MIVVAFSLDAETLSILDALASKVGQSRSGTVREIIKKARKPAGLRLAEKNGAALGREVFRLKNRR